MKKWISVCAALALAVAAQAAGPRVLFLTKSSGFQHSVITAHEGQPLWAEKFLTPVVAGLGGTVTTTKDASLISKDSLKNYDVVIFYTTGDLTTPGTDKQKPMEPTGQQELIDWIKGGGGWIGFHCASDTFHPDPQCGPPTPYIDTVGGEFAGHGRQFEGTIKVVSPEHPIAKNIPGDWKIADEWYTFCNLNTKNMHVIALMDAGDERGKQEMYNKPSYPVMWCRQLEKGRVFYDAQGHREDVWENPQFQKVVGDAILWASGKGDSNAEPNYDKVIPPAAAPEKK